MRTDDSVDDFHSRMVEADVVACLVTLVGYLLSLDLHESSAKAIITLAKFGRFLYLFRIVQGLIVKQIVSTLKWWNSVSFSALLTPFSTV